MAERKGEQILNAHTGNNTPAGPVQETRLIVCGGVNFRDYDYFSDRMDMLSGIYEGLSIISGHANRTKKD